MKALINWDALEEMAGPKRPKDFNGSKKNKDQGNMWDDTADFYNKMAMMELSYTSGQLDCLKITKEDTVLDVGCGPGRVSILAAERAKSVISMDSSTKMLEYCEQNAKERGIDNLSTKYMDWFKVEAGENIDRHDFVIASRTSAIKDPYKLSMLAKKYAAIMIFANAPSIPEMIQKLFGESIEHKPIPHSKDRRIGYNIIFNKIYDLGYEPNVQMVKDGFTKKFKDRESAYQFLLSLKPEVVGEKKAVAKASFDHYLKDDPDGQVEFRMETRMCVIWWRTDQSPLDI